MGGVLQFAPNRRLPITDNSRMSWLDQIKWDAAGLVPVIAQEQTSGDVLMFAWMDREALQLTASSGRAVYFSRSRKRLWPKGEESGHVQLVHEIRLDCDQDVVLLQVIQTGHEPGIACHTGTAPLLFSAIGGRCRSGTMGNHRSGLERSEIDLQVSGNGKRIAR